MPKSHPQERVVLVTGASSGIGKASALTLAQKGYTVYATARRSEALEDLKNAGLFTLRLDVTDESSMIAAVNAIEARHGAVDILVNNAGYAQNGAIEVLPIDDLRQQFETNVFGLVRLSQLVLPAMRRRGRGRIINIGSIGGTFSTLGAGAYHASKFAVEALSDALRAEVEVFGIDVCLIQPTGVYTSFDKAMAKHYPQVPADSPYRSFLENHKRASSAMFQGRNTAGIVPVEAVVKRIVHAASAKRPRTRYRVGLSAHILFHTRRLLPDRLWDKLTRAQFPVLAKESAGVGSSRTA